MMMMMNRNSWQPFRLFEQLRKLLSLIESVLLANQPILSPFTGPDTSLDNLVLLLSPLLKECLQTTS